PMALVNTVLPSVSGSAVQGQTLTGGQGSWSGNPVPSLANQWLRCDSAGANCVAISGATAMTYVLVAGDVGSTVRLQVTGTNTAGSAAASSAQTAGGRGRGGWGRSVGGAGGRRTDEHG